MTTKQLEKAVRKFHAAKGRHHTQIACCEMFDLLGLPNVKPGEDVSKPPSMARFIELFDLHRTLESRFAAAQITGMTGQTEGVVHLPIHPSANAAYALKIEAERAMGAELNLFRTPTPKDPA